VSPSIRGQRATSIAATVSGVWRNRWSVVGAAAVLLAGCAGNNPAGPSEGTPRTVTVVVSATAASPGGPAPVASAARVPAIPASAMSGEATCAWGARPMPSLDPSASFDVNDPGQRARRVLAEQHRPTPTRGVVPKAGIAGAEACVYLLRTQFALLTTGSRTAPDERAIEVALRSAGLTNIVVRSGPVFAAFTGGACVYGSFTATVPAFIIGPSTAAGSCRP
jgi:hypothetical protein